MFDSLFEYWKEEIELGKAVGDQHLREQPALTASVGEGMAAPRPIKGILKNKNNAASVKPAPGDFLGDKPEDTPGLSDEDQQWVFPAASCRMCVWMGYINDS